mgnify:CR=1 FL=1|jgi:hypothetical protein
MPIVTGDNLHLSVAGAASTAGHFIVPAILILQMLSMTTMDAVNILLTATAYHFKRTMKDICYIIQKSARYCGIQYLAETSLLKDASLESEIVLVWLFRHKSSILQLKFNYLSYLILSLYYSVYL